MSPTDNTRLEDLMKKQGKEALSASEEADLKLLCTIEQDIILVSEEERYDAEKLRMERLHKISAAEHAMDGMS